MKKYLLILFVLCILMYGCKFDRKTEQSSEEHVQSSMQQTENTMPVYSLLTSYDDIYNSYTKEAIDLYDQVYDTNYSEEKILSFAGREIPEVSLTDINGNRVNVADLKNKRVIYEFAASYCSHCKNVSKEVMEEIMNENEDVIFIQIFINGDSESVREFYEDINKEIPDELIVVPRESQVITLVEGLGLEYLPSLVFQDEFGKVSWFHQGDTTVNEMRKAIECAFGPKKIYEMIKDGISSQNDFILTYKDVKAHFEEETISLIEDVFHGEEIDFYGNLGNSFYMDTIKTLNKEKIETSYFINKKTVYIIVFADEEKEKQTKDIENYKRLSEKYTDTEFVFVFKSMDTQDISEYYSQVKDKIKIAYDKNDSTSLNDIYISSVPLYLFVDENNRICGTWVNSGDFEEFDKAYQLFYSDVPLYERIK